MTLTVEQFADIIGTSIDIRRHPNQNGRWTYKYDATEVQDGRILSSIYGDGRSIEEARDDYVNKISNTSIILHATSETLRRQFNVPQLT